MQLKKEWLVQLLILFLFYLDSIFEIDHHGLDWSPHPGIDFIFLAYHTTLFIIVNYVLIPRFFYPRRYLLFVFLLLSLIILYGVVEETIIEKILTPDSRGLNALTWQSIYWFFGEILVPLLAFSSTKLVFDNIANQQRLQEIERERLQDELKFLKSQIQPHILFNSLNNLYDYTLSKSDRAPELVLQLSNVLRYVLYETQSERVGLHKELQFLEDYIALQEMQLEGRGTLECQLPDSNQTEHLEIAPFLLIPFIENSFKHSIASKSRGIGIKIALEVRNHELHLSVVNNYVEQQPSSNDLLTSGIGLENARKRLDLLYPNRYSLQVHPGNGLFRIVLALKLAE